MADLKEMAQELGQAMARTDEYQALKRAVSAADEDREITELRNELRELEGTIETGLRKGEEPGDEVKEAYEATASKLQANSTYQRLVAAQSNFDRVVSRVNDNISKGLQEGADSRIVLPS